MNIETIKMEPEEAKEKLKAYKAKLKGKIIGKANKHVQDEYQTAIDTLRALGKGHAVLDIEEVIASAPIDDKERPRLAICRADLKQVKLEWYENSAEAMFIGAVETKYSRRSFYSRAADIAIEIDMARRHHYREIRSYAPEKGLLPSTLEGYSLVPLVPPTVELKAKLENYHILWEVEKWSDTEIGAKPDKDPYLLKRINSTLFAVIAEWDLTELEQLVMKRRIDI